MFFCYWMIKDMYEGEVVIYRYLVVYIYMRFMYIMIIYIFKMDFILKVKRWSFFEKILLDRNIYL